MSSTARSIVIVVAAVAIVALLLFATGEKGRLRQSGSLPVVTGMGQVADRAAATIRTLA